MLTLHTREAYRYSEILSMGKKRGIKVKGRKQEKKNKMSKKVENKMKKEMPSEKNLFLLVNLVKGKDQSLIAFSFQLVNQQK